jgi:nuclear GTP-binding protein
LEKKDYVEDVLNTNKAIGGENLLNLLKNYCRSEDAKKSIVVGIVGFPNVGKSSIINSLRRGKVAGVSSTPGYTKNLQEIVLDRNIKLIDSPGVVFSLDLDKEYNMILHNAIRIEDIKDPIEVVSVILQKVPKENLVELYKLESSWESTEQFLWLIGDKMGKYKKVILVNINFLFIFLLFSFYFYLFLLIFYFFLISIIFNILLINLNFRVELLILIKLLD